MPNLPLPVPLPPSPETDCNPRGDFGNGGKGSAGCNIGGIGFISSYDLGDGIGVAPQHDDPVEGEDLTNKTEIDIWIEVDIKAYPSGTITTYRKAFVELSPPDPSTYYGGRKAEGVIAIGDFEYALAQEAATLEIQISDTVDRLFRTQLIDQDLDGNEVRVFAASPARRAAALPPLMCYRGSIIRADLDEPLITKLQASDVLFADGGPFKKLWPPLFPKDIFAAAPSDTLMLPVPVLYGEKSDHGARDPNTGDLSEKGLCPGIFVGRQIVGDGVEPGGYLQDLTMPQPEWVSMTNILPDPGAPYFHGTIYVWFAALRKSDGKIGPWELDRHILNPNMDEVVPGSKTWPHIHFKFIDGEPDPDYQFIGFAGDDPTYHPITNPDVGKHGVAVHDGLTANSFYERDDGRDASLRIPVQGAVTAVPTPNEWGFLVFFLGEIYGFTGLYGSDLSGVGDEETKHDRIELTNLANRSDIMTPWDENGNPNANWPFPNTYVEYVDSLGKAWWFTGIFVRGPLLDDHINGVVNITCNAIGRMDPDGLPFMTANAARQTWLDNDVFNDYTAGAFVTNANAPKWIDGTYKVRSSAFTAHQAYTVKQLGSIGLGVSWYVGEQKTVLDHDEDWNLGTEALRGVNNHSQVTLGFLDETLSPTNWPHIVHVTDIFGPVKSTFVQNRENRIFVQGDWDPDFEKFRVGPIDLKSVPGYTKYKDRWAVNPDGLNIVTLNDLAQLTWLGSKRLDRLRFGEVPVDIISTIAQLGLPLDGPGVKLTTIEGRGASGYVETPMRLIRKRFSFSSRLTSLTFIDGTNLLDGTSTFGKTLALSTAGGTSTVSGVGYALGSKAAAAGVGAATGVGVNIFSAVASAAGVGASAVVGTTV